MAGTARARAMAKPLILIVDDQEARRRELARGLASFGYEVVTAADAAEGRRFAAGLNPEVVVSARSLRDQLGSPGDQVGAGSPLVIVLTAEDAPGGSEAPAIPTAGVAPEAVLHKVHTALVGRELGIATDVRFAALEGELEGSPALELMPRLQGAGVTGCLVLGEGDVTFEAGEVVAARAGGVRGVKAFVRVTRAASGVFRVVLGSAGVPREISLDVLSLMALAIEDRSRYEDAAASLPDLASRPRLMIGPPFFATQFNPTQQLILTAVQQGGTVGAILDRVPEPDGSVLAEIVHLRELGFVALDPPEIRVRIVTDSTADLPTDVAEQLGIEVVPLAILIGKEILRDGVDIKSSEIPALLGKGKGRAPETLPPSRGDFLAAYKTILSRSDVVSLHISSRLSNTFEHARAAAAEVTESLRHESGEATRRIEVVDSGHVSGGLMLLAVLAARMARRRLGAGEIRSRIEAILPRLQVLFAVDEVDFLARSSRIKGTQALFGGLLGIKPILGIVGGEVVPVERIRGGANVCARLVELLEAPLEGGRQVLACVGHAAAPELGARLADLIRARFDVAELFETEIGPAVAAHVGPGCVGAALFQPTAEELALLVPSPEVV